MSCWERLSLPEGFNNMAAFWLLGLCNNFGYVFMLSAAKDILEPGHSVTPNTTTGCFEDRKQAKCSAVSTGAVLLADIIPSLLVKLVSPFVFNLIAYNVRYFVVLLFQSLSFIVVAMSTSSVVGLGGVVLASLGAGLGDVTLLSLSAHFHSGVITSWSSGTGGAGITGTLVYAFLTDHNLFNLSPKTALFSALVVPVLFAFTFYSLLKFPLSVHKADLLSPSTYLIPAFLAGESSETASLLPRDLEQPVLHESDLSEQEDEDPQPPVFPSKWQLIKPLILPFMLPLTIVYFAEYFINQGLVELLVFDCAHGFHLSAAAQYRWHQVLYQVGVFTSRSSVGLFVLPRRFLPVFAVLQVVNAFGFVAEAVHPSVSYLWAVFLWILYEGVLGGFAYANTFKLLHLTVPKHQREFSMAFVSMADAIGILAAGLLALPTHNLICSKFFNQFV